jgi:ribonucleoside-triphosphate reductase (thioredoxin)
MIAKNETFGDERDNSADWGAPINSIQQEIIRELSDSNYIPFRLDPGVPKKYEHLDPGFGFDGVGELTYMRTYSRVKDDGVNEKWHNTIERVVNGTYNLQKRWIQKNGLEWSDYKAQESAQEMYDRMFHMKFLPPGRGLWAMGSEITEERGLYAALNNCAFVSTEKIKEDLAKPFTFLMDASMLGVGVGFDTKGAGRILVKGPDNQRQIEVYDIPDSREGWVESVRILIESYFLGIQNVDFKYNRIRPAGELIKGFGGKSSGPEPLKELHDNLRITLERNKDRPLTTTSIVDMQNLIGKCVIAGNVRRTAEIAFGDPYSEEFLNLKNYSLNPERAAWGWASNNSIFADIGMDYSEVAERIRDNGEPGIAWLDNMRGFSRMRGHRDNKDKRVAGGNPCLEQSLESYELCCLVETFPNRNTDEKDFLRTLKFAYMYAKTVTLGKTHWPEANRVLLRNRRIGTSMSGIAQFVANKGLSNLKHWAEEGYKTVEHYDKIYSDWLVVPESIKKTSIKPSGTVSILPGETPGMHYPESNYYIRRIRIGNNSELVVPLQNANVPLEPAVGSENSTLVAEFPVMINKNIRTEKEVPMWEQLSLAANLQSWWADNQVSCTIKFDPDTEGKEIKHALDHFQYHLKGISFLPKREGTFPQMPYEAISREEYLKRKEDIEFPLDFSVIRNEQADPEKFCDGDSCEIK